MQEEKVLGVYEVLLIFYSLVITCIFQSIMIINEHILQIINEERAVLLKHLISSYAKVIKNMCPTRTRAIYSSKKTQ